MARSGIRYEEVQEAAETLLGRGLNPTIQRVRELLGTGSNTTISEHLKHWQQQLAESPKAVLPPTVPETVMTALEPFWKIAVRQAEAAFEEQRAAAAQAVTAAEQTRDAAVAGERQAQAIADDLSRQLDATTLSARQLADQLLVARERRAAAEIAIEAAEQRTRAAMETAAQIRAETEARIAQMEAVLQQLRADMTSQQTQAQQRIDDERQRAEANETRLMHLLDQDRAEHTAERQAFATERQEWKNREAGWRVQLETQRRENIETRAALAIAEERLRVRDTELRQARAALVTAEGRYGDMARATDALRNELRAALDAQNRLRQSFEMSRQAQPDPKSLPESG
ncbi:MAG: DNA-binding protein [Candidatus Competibacteraceae bacterium]|nr:MAG: DNA-binding protein [Candidatus Competibacteraceae bacterium]